MLLFHPKNPAAQQYYSGTKKVFSALSLFFVLALCTSCVDQKKLVYFPDQQDTSLALASLPKPPEPIIQENDVLSITVSSLNSNANATINAPNFQSVTTGGSTLGTQSGYLVGANGFIEMPFLGPVKAVGLTKLQLADYLTKAYVSKGYLLDPIITIRQLNYHITLVGEVGRPGVYNIPSEKINMLEALGQGGDLTPYANRKTVVLIREEGGQRIFRRIDLNSSKLLSSPYYYLKSNDVVYAEPNKTRAVAVSNQNQIIGYGISAVGILFTIVTLIITLTR